MHLISLDKLGMNPADAPDASVAANVLNRFISRANKSIKSQGMRLRILRGAPKPEARNGFPFFQTTPEDKGKKQSLRGCGALSATHRRPHNA